MIVYRLTWHADVANVKLAYARLCPAWILKGIRRMLWSLLAQAHIARAVADLVGLVSLEGIFPLH